jgi:CheY-like chemotaxis protein
MLGGTLEVESELGKGTTFRLDLPVQVVDRAHLTPEDGIRSATERRRSGPSPEGAPLRFGCRVLVAEDNPDNQRLILDTLREAGAEVELAENGAIAIHRVREAQERGRPFEAILMDMQMPVLDGHEAVKRLRGMGCETPIVALTAHAMPGDREKYLAAGCDDYVPKPLDRRLLVRLIARCVAIRSGAAAS